MKNCIAIIAAISLSACASTGVKIDPQKLSGLQKGKTTYAEAIAALGKPTQYARTADGMTTISYIYVSTQVRPETLIPIAGAFVGGADSESSSVVLIFDKNGVLSNYYASGSADGTGTGFEALSQPRNSNQPGEVK